MSRRYSVWVREYMSDHDVELLDVNDHPQAMVDALRRKRVKIGKRGQTLSKYISIRIVDNAQTVSEQGRRTE